MQTSNTSTLSYTLKDAVVEAVKSLKSTGSFSAHDVTDAVREAVNEGEYTLPGFENPNVTSNIKYLVKHEAVKEVIDVLLNDGTMNTLGLTNINRDGEYRVFEFGTQAAPAADAASDDSVTDVDADGPVAQKIKAYLNRVGSATMKQIQSTLKVNGVTCKDLVAICEGLGFTVAVGTATEAYSTYTAE